jgi:hypothetical protein
VTTDFVRTIDTPKYGEIVILDDPGDVSQDDVGHVMVYAGVEGAVTAIGLPRFAHDIVRPFTRAELDPTEIQHCLDSLDRAMCKGKLAELVRERKHDTFCKIFRSEKYGQVVAIKNGDMDNSRPHIMVQFRPTRPTTIRAISLITASDQQPEIVNEILTTPEELKAGLHYFINLRFQKLNLEQIESCIEGWIKNAPTDRIAPLTFT